MWLINTNQTKKKENSNTVRHLNNGTDHRHSKSCCDQSSPARRTIIRMHGCFGNTYLYAMNTWLMQYVTNDKHSMHAIYVTVISRETFQSPLYFIQLWADIRLKVCNTINCYGFFIWCRKTVPDSKLHGANLGPTWVLSAPDGPHDGPMNLALRRGAQTYPEPKPVVCPQT